MQMVDRPFVRDTHQQCCTKKKYENTRGESRDIFGGVSEEKKFN